VQALGRLAGKIEQEYKGQGAMQNALGTPQIAEHIIGRQSTTNTGKTLAETIRIDGRHFDISLTMTSSRRDFAVRQLFGSSIDLWRRTTDLR